MTKSMARMLGSISTIPLMLVLTSCGAKPPSPTTTTVPGIGPLPAIAATVDGKTISTTAVVNQSFVDGGAAALGQLIDYEVLDQAAAKQNIVVTQSDIDAQFQQLANGSGRSGMGGGALSQELTAHHVPVAIVDSKIRHQIILERISSSELPGPRLMVHVRTILIATRPTQRGVDYNKPHTPADALAIIQGIQSQLKTGKKFEDLARKYSEDPSSRDEGGDIGIIDEYDDPFTPGANQIGGPLWDAAQGLKPGQVYPKPVRSYLGYHLVQVVSWSTSPLPSDAQSYASIVKNMRDFTLQRLETGEMARLRNKAKINETLFNTGGSG